MSRSDKKGNLSSAARLGEFAPGQAASPSQALTHQLSQRESPWQSTQTSSLCQGLSLWERWHRAAMTERASPLSAAPRFRRKLFRTAKGPIPEGAVERSETGGVCSRRAREQQLFPVWKTACFPAFSTQKNGGGPVLKTWGQPFQIGEK